MSREGAAGLGPRLILVSQSATNVAVLREMKLTGNEVFAGFTLRRFDGGRETI